MKVGRNDKCPCGSSLKFKKCCLKRGLDFNKIPIDEWIRSLPIQGKNILFINRLAEALQLDSIDKHPGSFRESVLTLKKSITPRAVQKIHEAIPEIWPDRDDLARCMAEERENHSGLFIGNYLVNVTARILNRHALYDDSIILIDPFCDPRNMRPEYNPIEKPEEHITTTFHYVFLWLQLFPWIEKGIVKIIRNPGDFDPSLLHYTTRVTQERLKESDELKRYVEGYFGQDELMASMEEHYKLSHPDEFYLNQIKNENISDEELKAFLKKRREESLHYVDVGRQPQILKYSTGTNYEMGKFICELTNSHIITDIKYRWKEMVYDRDKENVEIASWTSFAKAFQESKIKHLNGLTFTDLLKLRNDGYLEDMRGFLRRVWNLASTGDVLSEDNVENLSSELLHQINNAEGEWNKIDTNLVKWFGSESILGTVIAVASGIASWIPAVAVAAAGAVSLTQAKLERNKFINRYPAAFFIDSIRKNT